MSNYSKLSEHKFVKGQFITPMNDTLGDVLRENPWFQNRLPEYLWIGLILKKYERTHGLNLCLQIIQKLIQIDKSLVFPAFSQILKLPEEQQIEFFDFIIIKAGKDSLAPLTTLFNQQNYPTFAKKFFDKNFSYESRFNLLLEMMKETSFHQSNEATDIRYIILAHQILSEHLCVQKEHIENMKLYPSISHLDERMHYIRPFIRASEMSSLMDELGTDNSEYIAYFWETVSKMSECELYSIQFDMEQEDKSEYMQKLKSIMEYFCELLQVSPLDEKLTVMLGIVTYSYKRLLELVEHNLFNTISGRSIIRILIEDYLMLKYLLKEQSNHENIWKEYQYYGIGQYKIILGRHRETTADTSKCHFNKNYIELLVNEFKDENFLNMDTRYFGSLAPRNKADYVGEKELYGLYYDYDSSFEHGLWGAIRESSLLKCNSPMHQYHCVPDVQNMQKLTSVWDDCKMIMAKTFNLMDKEFGIPEHLKLEEK